MLEVRFLNLQLYLVQCDHRLRQIHQNMLGLPQGFRHLWHHLLIQKLTSMLLKILVLFHPLGQVVVLSVQLHLILL